MSIRERLVEAEDCAVHGHREGGLGTGTNETHIATQLERHTRYVMLVKRACKDRATEVYELAKHPQAVSGIATQSDLGPGQEVHAHKRFTLAAKVHVHFCDPRNPWQC